MDQFARIPARDPFGALTQSLVMCRKHKCRGRRDAQERRVLGGAIRGMNTKKTCGGIRCAIPPYAGYLLKLVQRIF